MTGFRPQFWPTVIAVPIVLLCLGLGAWQVERLLLEGRADRRARRGGGRTAHSRSPQRGGHARHGVSPGHRRGRVSERQGDLSRRHVARPAERLSGADAAQGAGRPHRLRQSRVYPGCAQGPGQAAGRRAQRPGAGRGAAAAAARGRPSWFLPDNRPDHNYWFWVDLPAMAKADRLGHVASFYIDADATPNPGGWPKGGVTPARLAERPSAIRDHVVFPGGGDDRHLCPVSSPQRGARDDAPISTWKRDSAGSARSRRRSRVLQLGQPPR